METGLQKAHAGRFLPGRAIEDVLHQARADAAVLYRRIDGDGPDPDD